MKKLKFINIFLIGLIGLYIINLVASIYVILATDFMTNLDAAFNQVVFGQYTTYVVMFFSLITCLGLIFAQRGLGISIRMDFFNDKSSKLFKKSSWFLMTSGLLSLIFNGIIFIKSEEIYLIGTIGMDFLLIFIALILSIVSDIIANGNELKIENDLTI